MASAQGGFPTERTNVEACEHRFSGHRTYSISHRTPLSVWLAMLAQYHDLPATGGLTAGRRRRLLPPESAIPVRSPDPTQRQAAVDQYIINHGLPTTLSSPVNLYAQPSRCKPRPLLRWACLARATAFSDRLLLAVAAHYRRRQRYSRVHCWF
jgi:hypothetical protein